MESRNRALVRDIRSVKGNTVRQCVQDKRHRNADTGQDKKQDLYSIGSRVRT